MSSLQVVFSFASDSREVNQCCQQICYLEKILNIAFSVRKYKLPTLKIVIRIGIKTFLSLVSLSGLSSWCLLTLQLNLLSNNYKVEQMLIVNSFDGNFSSKLVLVGWILQMMRLLSCNVWYNSVIKLNWNKNQFSHIFQTVEEQPGFVTGDPSFPIKRENGKWI